MKAKGILRTVIIVMILCLNVGCDQVSKNIIREKVDYYERISVVRNCFTIMKVENTGAFLSMGNSLPKPVSKILLIIFPLIVISLALFYLFTRSNLSKVKVLAFCCVLGGGIGNLYDRAIHGSVTDFLHIDFGLFQTGVFNMADLSIMTGMFIFLIEAISERAELKYSTSDN